MATEKSLNKFVIDTMLSQRDDIRAIIGFITRARLKILNHYQIDTMPPDRIPDLAKVVRQLERMVMHWEEIAARIGERELTVGTGNIEIDELASDLASLDKEDVSNLKQWLRERKSRKFAVVKDE